MALAVSGCFQPLRPSDVHLKPESGTPPSAAIPAPVPLSAALPKPRPALKPETYSVVVNQVPVAQLLFALARDAKMNVDVHPGITGQVTLNAIDQTLPQLLNRISKQVDMRWELDGPNLIVQPDSPYLRIYKVDYLNVERTSTGQVTVSSQIQGAGAGVGGVAGGGAATGLGGSSQNASVLTIRNTSSNKFWDTLVKNVEEILRETDKILPGGANPQPAAASTPPAGAPGAGGPGTPAQPNILFREAASVIAHAEAGVLFIRATGRQHEKLQEFLDQVLSNARRQVLVEATIVEVELSNSYQQGIDWTIVRQGVSGVTFGQIGGIPGTTQPSVFSLGYDSRRLQIGVKLLESFGTVRVLSSPRMSVLNNQTAALRVVRNLVYFNVSSQQQLVPNAGSASVVTTVPQTAPVGLLLNLTPQISEQGQVVLNLKPTLRRQVAEVRDPNPILGTGVNRIENVIPVIEERELESVMRLQSGEIGVLGGLIQDERNDSEAFIPGANRLPVIGNVFGNRNLGTSKRELVIFLRPVVVRDPSLEGDYRGYKVMLPGEDFMSRPNPGRTEVDLGRMAK